MSPLIAQSPLPAGTAHSVPEALALLRDDHDALREVFHRYRRLAGQGASAADRAALAQRACTMVEMHASIGEELVYPAAADAATGADAGEDDLIRMTGVECETCRKIIRQVRAACPTEPRFDALMLALAQCVERRLRREEAQLFGRVRRAHVDLADLGRRIRRRHEAWLAS